MRHADLFPEHFIYALEAPSNYVGADKIFYPDGVYYSLAISANVNKDDGSSLSDAAMAPTGWSSKLSTGTNKDNITGLTILDATGADGKKSGNAFDQHAVYIVPGGQCADDVVIQSTARHFAVLYRLEGAGTYCIDDQ